MKNNYAVIGDPVSHSLSPAIYNALFACFGLNAAYTSLTIKKGELPAKIDTLRQLSGFNVTMPHKRDILPYLVSMSDAAVAAQAVNTVVVDECGGLHGHTTDGEGFAQALAHAGGSFAGKHVAFFGAGGAAESVASRAAKQAHTITILARRPERAAALCTSLTGNGCAVSYRADIDALDLSDCGLLINATPQGMKDHPPFPSLAFLEMLPKGALVADMVYEPRETPLLQKARQLGHPVLPGLHMLLWQALHAFTLYTGIVPDERAVQIAARALGETT